MSLSEIAMPRVPRTILLVAGPSGSGKSTFIQCLKSGGLPAELRSLLPEAATAWPHFEANNFLKCGIAVDSALQDPAVEDGLILHFDTAFGRRYGMADYVGDPAAELMQRASSIVIVNIHPSPETLGAQFERRLAEQRRRRGWARELWRHLVHLPARTLVRRLRGQALVDTSRIYRSASDLDECYRKWSQFARALVEMKPGSRLVCIEPHLRSGREPAFVVKTEPAEMLVSPQRPHDAFPNPVSVLTSPSAVWSTAAGPSSRHGNPGIHVDRPRSREDCWVEVRAPKSPRG
jgi:hypothetical protein